MYNAIKYIKKTNFLVIWHRHIHWSDFQSVMEYFEWNILLGKLAERPSTTAICALWCTFINVEYVEGEYVVLRYLLLMRISKIILGASVALITHYKLCRYVWVQQCLMIYWNLVWSVIYWSDIRSKGLIRSGSDNILFIIHLTYQDWDWGSGLGHTWDHDLVFHNAIWP